MLTGAANRSHLSKQTTQEYIETRIEKDETTGCWDWIGTIGMDGYGKAKREGKTIRAHRLSYSFYNKQEITSDLFVCHKCDNPKCVNPDHLWLGTHYENELDKTKKGRRSPMPTISHPHLIPRGEGSAKSKLTNTLVGSIYKLGLQYKTANEIKSILDIDYVHKSTINNIIKGKTWQHLNLIEKYGRPAKPFNIGERNPGSKLNDEKVRFIRSSNLTQADLANKFGVAQAVISAIKTFKTWKHVL